jgi:cyclopropane fatty-acyl-phospholipid synthase-like methyltransferase
MDEPGRVKPVADFLEGLMGLKPGARILDAPCGEGRIARELARRGHRVTGLDLTPAFLKEARRKARQEGLQIEWRQGDMRRPPGRGRFDLALCWWGSFGYFSDSQNLRHVTATARSLKSGGAFVIDAPSSETVFPAFIKRWWVQEGEIFVLNESHYDTRSGRIETDWTFLREGRRTRAHSSIRLYSRRELQDLCSRAGLGRFKAFGSVQGEPFELDARRLVFAAFKA